MLGMAQLSSVADADDEKPPSGRPLAQISRKPHQHARQKQRVAEDVAAKLPGMATQDVQPLDAASAHPQRRPVGFSCPVADQAADTDAQARLQLRPVACDPIFLQRIAHADQQEIGATGIDRLDYSLRLLLIQKAVMVTGNCTSWIVATDVLGSTGGYLGRGAQHEATQVAASRQEGRHEVRAVEICLLAHPPTRRCPTRARAIGKDQLRLVQHAPKGRIGGGGVERMGIDEEQRGRCARRHHRLDLRQRLVHVSIENLDAQHCDRRRSGSASRRHRPGRRRLAVRPLTPAAGRAL